MPNDFKALFRALNKLTIPLLIVTIFSGIAYVGLVIADKGDYAKPFSDAIAVCLSTFTLIKSFVLVDKGNNTKEDQE